MSSKRSCAWVMALAMAACGPRQDVPDNGSGGTDDAIIVEGSGRFAFYSDPWINLHHFLYQWARADEGLGTGRGAVEVREREGAWGLEGDDLERWNRALAFYRESVAPLGHFDDGMLTQKRALLGLDGDVGALPPDEIPGVSAALSAAMPVYSGRWWPGHDEANRAWIRAVAPLVRRYEEEFAEATARIHGAEWPTERWRADVSAYANPRGGYTAEGHLVLHSRDPGSRDLHALEIVLHEVQHTRAIGSRGRLALSGAFEEAGVELPFNLWHGVIFGTAGAFVQSVAEEEGLPRHTPYWIREGFEGFRGWSEVVPPVQELWVPVVRGASTKDEGVAALVEHFGGS